MKHKKTQTSRSITMWTGCQVCEMKIKLREISLISEATGVSV